MKKYLITLAIILASAFSASAQFHLGAGYAYSASKASIQEMMVGGPSASRTVDSKLTTSGVYAGIDYNFKIVGGLGVDLGLVYTYLNGDNSKGEIGLVNARLTEHNLSVPLYLDYAFDLGDIGFFVYAGPSAQYGLSATLTRIYNKTEKNSNIYSEEEGFNRFNAYAGGGVGVNFKHFLRISFGYEYGLVDRMKADDASFKNNLFHAGIAFIF